MRLDSVIFHTPDLAKVRAFYKDARAGMPAPPCARNGAAVSDEDENYVNFEAGAVLLCFERGQAAETGTVVLRVPDLAAARGALDPHPGPLPGGEGAGKSLSPWERVARSAG